MSVRIIVLCALGIAAGYGIQQWDKNDRAKAAAAKARAEQEAKAEAERKRQMRLAQIERDAPETKRKNEEFAARMEAEQRGQATLETMRQLSAIADRYRDAARLAINTPRIALAQPIAAIQQLAREARTVRTSPCTAPVKQSLVTAIESTVEALLASMAQGDTAAPSSRASAAIQSFQAGMAECSQNPSKS